MKLKTRFYLEISFFTAIGVLLMFAQKFEPTMIQALLISIISLNISFWLPAGNFLMNFSLAGLALFDPNFIYFFPINVRISEPQNLPILIIPLITGISWLKILVFLFCLLSIYLSYGDKEIEQLKQRNEQLQDSSYEQLVKLQRQNLDLESNEQTKLQLKLADERNQIARDIHDNVGHLLSSSIIQLGAIEILNQDSKLTHHLTELNNTINMAMDSIRDSVHGIQRKSLTLDQAMSPIIADFSFCELKIEGTPFTTTSFNQNQVISMTIKEALTNVIKHSEAGKVVIKFQELPAFYHVQIRNNGITQKTVFRGMGLTNMQQRAEEANGQLHINQDCTSFTITLILPRKEINAKNTHS